MTQLLKIDERMASFKDRDTVGMILGDEGLIFMATVQSIYIDAPQLEQFFEAPDPDQCENVGLSIWQYALLVDKGAQPHFHSPESSLTICAIIHRHFVEFAQLLRELPNTRNVPFDDLRLLEKLFYYLYEQCKANYRSEWIKARTEGTTEISNSNDLLNSVVTKEMTDEEKAKMPDEILEVAKDVSVNNLELIARKTAPRSRLGGIRR